MTSRERFRQAHPAGPRWVGRIAAFGWLSFRHQHPPAVLAVTILPRSILQSIFFVLLAYGIGGPARADYAVFGTAVITMPIMCTASIAHIVTAEKWSGTLWRLRSGVLSPTLVLLLRTWPYAAAGWLIAIVAMLAGAVLTGRADLVPDLIRVAPIYAVAAATMSVAGLAVTTVALGERFDMVAGNLLAYLIMLASGAFVPLDRVPWVRPIAGLLPGTNALAAVRSAVADRPWAGSVLLEVGTGLLWLAVAAAVIGGQLKRMRRTG